MADLGASIARARCSLEHATPAGLVETTPCQSLSDWVTPRGDDCDERGGRKDNWRPSTLIREQPIPRPSALIAPYTQVRRGWLCATCTLESRAP